jgi:hypothetical protein
MVGANHAGVLQYATQEDVVEHIRAPMQHIRLCPQHLAAENPPRHRT